MMARCISILWLSLIGLRLSAASVDQITVNIAVTNAPASDGDDLTLNSDTRTWRTSPTIPASEVTIDADNGTSATNLWNHFATYPQANATLGWTATNAFNVTFLPGQAVTDSMTGTWGSMTRSTNTITTSYLVSVPAAAAPVQSTATNVFSLLVNDLGTYSTNALGGALTTTMMQNYVDRLNTQSVGGDKYFYGSVILAGNTNILTREIFFLTNAVSYFKAGTILDFEPGVIIRDSGVSENWNFEATADADTVFRWGDFTNQFVAHIRDNGHTYTGTNTFNLLTGSTVDASAITKFTNLTGSGGTVTNITQYSSTLYSPTITNVSTQVHKFPMSTSTTLAAGNNAGVDFGVTSFVRVDAGPGAAFTINGIVGGSDGRVLKIYNNTGQDMTIANQSGVDATPANRIITMTGADITTTAAGFTELIYDSNQSRWIAAYVTQ